MSTTEIVILAVSSICLIVSFVTLYLTYEWKIRVEQKCGSTYTFSIETRDRVSDFTSVISRYEDDLYKLKKIFADAGIETMKVRSEDHDKAIEAIRRDLLDLQVISGTLPSKAGTMLDEVENTLEELKTVQRNYLETREIVDTSKQQVEALAKAYSDIYFTNLEFEKMRDRVQSLSDNVKNLREEIRDADSRASKSA